MITINNRKLLIPDDDMYIEPYSLVRFKDESGKDKSYRLLIYDDVPGDIATNIIATVPLVKMMSGNFAVLSWKVLPEHFPIRNRVIKFRLKIDYGNDKYYYTETECLLHDERKLDERFADNVDYQMGYKEGH